MEIVKYIAIVIVGLIILAVVAPFFQARTPEAYVRADNEAIRMLPTATAAALANAFEGTRVAIVAPAVATAEAASILANNQQRIDEDAHQQNLRHQGEMAALGVSNTLRLNQVQADYTARVEGIKADGAQHVAEANANAARASAGAWRDTIAYGGIALGAVVVLLGGALAIVTWLSTRAKIIDAPSTGPLLVTGRGVVVLGNITTPVIAWDNRKVLASGDSVPGLVAQRQAFALLGRAKDSDIPEMVRAADRLTTQAVQSNVTPNLLHGQSPLDSAIMALPGNGDLSGNVPTFAKLLQGWRPSIQQMLFGFAEDGSPVYGSLDQLLSALVIGRQGQGKTTLLRLINLQCAITGVKVIGWDIHDDIAEDVPGIEVYTSAEDIARSARALNAELDQRIRLKLKHDKARPVMVLIDEVNLIVDRVPMLVDIIKRIVSEGRKYRMFEFITAKGAPSDIFEKSWARDSFSALISFWSSALQARNAGFEADSARRVETLTPGHALLRLQTAPAQVVTLPDLSLHDMQQLFSGSASTPASMATSEPLSGWTVSTSEKAEKSGESGEFETLEVAQKRARAIEMLKAGNSQRDVIAAVWGATGGNDYKLAAQELSKFIQESLS